jgi:hypothetical protein
MHRLAASPEDRELRDALLLVGADALYYSAPLTLGLLAAAGALPQFMGALSAAVSARGRSGRMRHFPSQREKKVCALGLTAVLAAPDAALAGLPGVGESLGQVAAAVVAVLSALKAQEEEAAEAAAAGSAAGGSASASGSEAASSGGAGSDGDDDESEPDDVALRRSQRATARRARDEADEEDELDSDEDWWYDSDDEAEVSSPIDAVSPYVYFADVLQAAQASDPARLARMAGQMDAAAQAAVQALMEHAAAVRQMQAAAAAAAAAAAVGGQANGGPAPG